VGVINVSVSAIVGLQHDRFFDRPRRLGGAGQGGGPARRPSRGCVTCSAVT